MFHPISRSWLIACWVATGLFTMGGPAVAASAAPTAKVSQGFCQTAADAFSSTANVVPSVLPSASISAQYVILLDNVTGAYSRLIAQTPSSGPKYSYEQAETFFRRALNDERSAHSASSSSAQHAAFAQYQAGLRILIDAAPLPYRTCAGLKGTIAGLVTSALSWDAVKAAASNNRAVSTADLRSAAHAVAGVRIVSGITATSRTAKFRVSLAGTIAGNYCVVEPAAVRGLPSVARAC